MKVINNIVYEELPDDFLIETDLTPEQIKLLIEQIRRYEKLKKLPEQVHAPSKEQNGKLVLKKGTIIHGTSYNEDKIAGIKKEGILTGNAVGVSEDCETFYCADFHRVTNDVSLEEYDKSFPYNDGRTPFGGKGKRSLAFIITPNDINSELLNYDCYREGIFEAVSTRELVNSLPIKDKDKGASILYGVPGNMIEGIVLGDNLLLNKEVVEKIVALFPKCYISAPDGSLIYDPTFLSVEASKLIHLKREKYCYEKRSNDLEIETTGLNDNIINLRAQNLKLQEDIIRYCSAEVAAQILIQNGFSNGGFDAVLAYVIKKQTEMSSEEPVENREFSLN